MHNAKQIKGSELAQSAWRHFPAFTVGGVFFYLIARCRMSKFRPNVVKTAHAYGTVYRYVVQSLNAHNNLEVEVKIKLTVKAKEPASCKTPIR